MDDIEIFPWDDHFITGLAELDELNRQLVDLTNRFAAHVALGLDKLELDSLFDELLAHSDYHFTTEEAIWHEYLAGDAEEERHRDGHGDFFATLFCLNAELATQEPADAKEGALDYLVAWLIAHLLEDDRRAAAIVLGLKNGLSIVDAKRQADAQSFEIDPEICTASARNTLRAMRELACSQPTN